VRFEVVGRLIGSVVATEAVPVRNLGPGGALIEAPWPLPSDTIYTVRLESASHVTTCDARVRHVTRAADRQGTFLIGLEFLRTDPLLLDDLEQFTALDSLSSE
jgi:hypothetical protein